MQLEPAEATGLMAPAGELWSTAEDLCRFAAFLLDGDDRVLAASTLAEMRDPAAPPGDDAWGSGYGLGLQLFRRDGRVLYGHSGSMPGFLATLCVSPDDGVGGIALANATSGADIAAIAVDLVEIVADHEPRLPARWKPLPDVDQALLALTGLWYWGPRPYLLRLRADRAVELSPAAGKRPRLPASAPSPTAPGPVSTATTRARPCAWCAARTARSTTLTWDRSCSPGSPTSPVRPLAARPDPDGWRAG